MLSPGGERTLQLLTRYWLQRAPKIAGWDFYRFKQGHDGARGEFEMLLAGHRYAIGEFRVALAFDKTSKHCNVRVYHPHFANSTKRLRRSCSACFLRTSTSCAAPSSAKPVALKQAK